MSNRKRIENICRKHDIELEILRYEEALAYVGDPGIDTIEDFCGIDLQQDEILYWINEDEPLFWCTKENEDIADYQMDSILAYLDLHIYA